jgi:hypothetical protein
MVWESGGGLLGVWAFFEGAKVSSEGPKSLMGVVLVLVLVLVLDWVAGTRYLEGQVVIFF